MTNGTESDDGVLRRTVLKAGTVTLGTLAMVTAAAGKGIEVEDEDEKEKETEDEEETENEAEETVDDEEITEDEDVDSPEGFTVEVLAPHANFTNDVAAKFRIEYDEGDLGTVVSDLPDDASTVVVAKATWEPMGTTGWHTHPGPAIATVTEGELELVNAHDCVTRTYEAGEAFVDPGQGNVHTATNPSETENAEVYVTFLGVPDGGPATVWVEPADCED